MILPDHVKQAEIFIYNLEGKQITRQNITSRGNTSASFGSGVIEPGMYLYALIVDGEVVDQKRMILTK